LAVIGGGLGMVGLGQVGCGGTTVAATGGSTGSMHTASHSTSGTSMSTSGTGGNASGSGGGNSGACQGTGFANAVPITVGSMATPDTLPDAVTPCYYSFQGKKGDRFLVSATAYVNANMPMDGSVTDTVVTLYLPDKQTIWALNDDAWPRPNTDSALFTELPMDGTYYFTVEDCNALAAVNPNVSCYCVMPGMPAGCTGPGVSDFAYQVFVGDLTASKAESLGSATATTNVTYTPVPMMTGSYFDPTIDGDIATQTDVHKFTLTPPGNTMMDPTARSRAYFFVQPYGSGDGTGTALDIVLTATDMQGHVLAKADQQYYTNGDDSANGPLQFQFPLDDQFGNKFTSTYNLAVSVSNKTAIAATKNFYIIDHHAGPYYFGQAEKEGPAGSGMNDAVAMAETLTVPKGQMGLWAIDGNLSSPTDVDWFTLAVPAGSKNANLGCRAARDGSGLTGFTAVLYKDAMGMNPLITLGPEGANPTKELNSATPGPSITGITTMTLKISATGQDAVNQGTFYNCAVSVQ
jgi:hypothetical protein